MIENLDCQSRIWFKFEYSSTKLKIMVKKHCFGHHSSFLTSGLVHLAPLIFAAATAVSAAAITALAARIAAARAAFAFAGTARVARAGAFRHFW